MWDTVLRQYFKFYFKASDSPLSKELHGQTLRTLVDVLSLQISQFSFRNLQCPLSLIEKAQSRLFLLKNEKILCYELQRNFVNNRIIESRI